VTYLMGDRGLPLGWQYMNGYGSHTYQWINAAGKSVWVKFHFKTELGVKNLTRQDALRIAGEDPDFHRRSFFDLIAGGDVASWKLYVQIMPLEDAATYRFDPFDVTKVLSHKDYPLIPVGRMVLNRNPENFHTDIEQAAFEPSNVVPGVSFSPDKMLQGRIFAYADAHRYRIGTNYMTLPVNRPRVAPANYMRDGLMRGDANGGTADNYEPNSFGGPVEDHAYREPPYVMPGNTTGRFDQKTARNDDYVQAGDLYRLMAPDAQDRIVDQIVTMMTPVRRDIQLRAVGNFGKCDATFGERLARGLGLNELLAPSTTGARSVS
jgi:catalase